MNSWMVSWGQTFPPETSKHFELDCTGLAPNKKAAKNLKKVPKFTFFVCFKSGSGFNRVSGSGFGIRIRIQEGKNDQRKLKKL